eukprot:scaffold1199_cov143-Skeletonema_menzelii.AAC.2
MNRPHAVGTLLVRLEDNNGRADSENSTGGLAAMTESSRNPARRAWWQLIGKKEDRFIWQGSCGRGRGEEVLYKPNFEYDADQVIADSRNKQGTDAGLADVDNGVVAEEKKRIIDQRMHTLSSLFTCHHYGHHDTSSRIRATDLTDDEFIDIILNQTHNPVQEEREDETTTFEHGTKQIIQKYEACRQEKRNLSNTYIADRRSILPEPWIERDDGEQSSVQIDRHGRLVRTRHAAAAAAANDDRATESSNDGPEEVELVDAAGIFWRHVRLSNEGTSRCDARSEISAASNGTGPGIQQPQQPPPLLQPLPQNPLNQQHIRERRIAQQMENESRQAIERAIHRYRGHQQQERDGAVFEMVPIPLIRQINEANVPRWLRFLSFNRHHQQHANNNEGENPNQQQNDPNEQQDHQNGERDDLRLTLRRICFAVITVTAAFICMMLQGLPLVDFGDDVIELNPIFLSGLMGPHFPGHHAQQHQNQRRNEWIYLEVEEEEEGDGQQSIWNRFGVEDRYHLPRGAASQGAAPSFNQGREL